MPLRALIAIALLVSSLISGALMGVPLLLGADTMVTEGGESELERTQARVQDVIDARIAEALAIAQVIAAMPRVQRAVDRADTKGLHRLFVKDFEEWSAASGVTFFQFHSPQSISILRVHEPDTYGDDLTASRPLVVAANAASSPAAGVLRTETGLNIRAVTPVIQSDDHVGSVEIGMPLDQALLDKVTEGSGTHLEVYVLPLPGSDAVPVRMTSNYDGPPLMTPEQLATPGTLMTPYRISLEGGETDFGIAFPISDTMGNVLAYGNILVPDTAYAAIKADMVRTATISSLVALVLALLMALVIGGRLTGALNRLVVLMRRLSKGDTDFSVDDLLTRNRETSNMAEALEVFRQSRIEADALKQAENARQAEQAEDVRTIASGLHSLAEGDLGARLPDDLSQAYVQIARDFNKAAESLSTLVSGISVSSDSIGATTEQISSATEDLSVRTENNAATLEEASAALTQITESVGSAADEAKGANQSGESAIAKARSGADVVSDTVNAMTEIDTSAQEIARITTMIDDIAFQTNLLALNAGVEAARAGNAGSGFAVVAAEVRGLAQRTAEAARQIGGLIKESGEKVQHGVTLVGRTGTALDDIVNAIERVTTQVARISELTDLQRSQLTEINIAVAQLDRSTQHNAAMFQQSNASNRTLKEEGERLRALVGTFRTESVRPPVLALPAPDAFEPGHELPEGDGWEAA